MPFNHRKMLVSNLPEKGYNLTIYIPCFQIYTQPPPPPPPPPPPSSPLETDLSLIVTTMICILGSVLLFLFLVVFLYLHITQLRRSSTAEVSPGVTNRREEDEDEESEERDFSGDHHVWRVNTSGLHRSVVDSITVVGFKKREGTINGTECSVCLNEFEEDQSLRLLPQCSHAFHINCIDTWLLSHKTCPLCRAPVLLTHQETETNHQSSESRSSNDLRGEEESSITRNVNVLSRSHGDLANHCGGSASVETVRRSFSIGGSSSLKAEQSDDRSRRHFCSSFSANFFSSSRRSRHQDQVLPTRMPSVSC